MKIHAHFPRTPVQRSEKQLSLFPAEEHSGPKGHDNVQVSFDAKLQSRPPSKESLQAQSEQSAFKALSSAAIGGLWNLALGIANPVKNMIATADFGLSFMSKLRTRADEITTVNKEVDEKLKTEGMHDAYEAPVNKVNKKLEGKMTIKASMDEFYRLWDFWIDEGYGSINDRQYGDVVKMHSEKAKDLPLLKYVPVTSVDSFTAEIKDGKMLSMTETTKAKVAGIIPTSTVDWVYRRKGDPTGSNSFEKTVDKYNGDLEQVESFYNALFDPKRLDPNSKATVEFVVDEVDELPALPESDKEFEHSVKVPGGFLIPKSSELLSQQRDPEFVEKYGPWAVVTGASGGIGSQYADVLSEKGMNVVLVARNGEKLEKLAEKIRKENKVEARVVQADLTSDEGVEGLFSQTNDLEVGMLVNNAGMWQFGSFLENDVERDAKSIALNTEAPLRLTHHFGKGMKARGKGGIINVGSGAALHGVPGQSAYSATKGFMQNFTSSLYQELKPHNIDVIVTNPGPVKGEASEAYDQSKNPLQMVTGREVAEDSIKNLGKKSTTIPGGLNKLAMGSAVRLMPRDLLSSIAGFILEKAGQ